MTENGADPCLHAKVAIIGQVNDAGSQVRILSLAAVCEACREPFIFMGLPISLDPTAAGILQGGLQVHLPLVARSLIYPEPEPEEAPPPKRPPLEIVGGHRRLGN